MSGSRYERLVRLVLRLYTGRFRASLGEDMVATMRDRYGAQRSRGSLRGWRFVIGSLAGLLWGAVLERLASSRGPNIDGPLQAWRSAWRSLRASPGLAFGVIAAFALGLGANATVFVLVDRLLLSPPPHLADPGSLRIVAVETYSSTLGDRFASPVRPYPELRDWESASTLEGIAGFDFSVREVTSGRGQSRRRLRMQTVTGTFFSLLGVRPVAGRLLSPSDDRVGADPVAVISEEVWRRDHGGAPDVIGRTVDFGRGPHVIVGVAPRGFTGVGLSPVDLWVPLAPNRAAGQGADWDDRRDRSWLRIVVRLAPEATEEAAASELTILHRAATAAAPAPERFAADSRVVLASVIPGRSPLRPMEVDVARWVAGVSLALLLLACVNITNLLLARQVRQQRMLAVRRALGASRLRLVWMAVLEAAVLALAGGAAAILVAGVAGPALGGLLLPDVAWAKPGSVTLSLAAWAGGLAVGATLLAVALPAFRLMAERSILALRAGASTDPGRTRATLVVVQVALSAVLVVGAGLFVRSFHRAASQDLGIEPEAVYLFTLDRADDPGPGRDELNRRAVVALAEMPGIESAAASATYPFFQRNAVALRVEGADSVPFVPVHTVAGDYFGTLRLERLAGRLIEAGDVAGAAPVAVVNRAMASGLWADADPQDRCLYIGGEGSPCTRVVGVVENALLGGVGSEPAMQYYVPAAQQTPTGPLFVFMARFRSKPTAALVEEVRRTLAGLDPDVEYVEAFSLPGTLEHQLRPWRLGATLFGAFSALALLLSGIGLHALLAFDVSRRRRELGIRAALGASRDLLLRGTVGRAFRLAMLGALLGGGAAVLLIPRVEVLLFETGGYDPVTLLVAAAVLAMAALVGSARAAWAAATADPSEALRAEP